MSCLGVVVSAWCGCKRLVVQIWLLLSKITFSALILSKCFFMPSTFLFLISSSVSLLLFSLVLCACVCLLVDFCVSLISCLLPILSASLVHGHCCFIQQVSVSPCVMYYIVGLFFCVSLYVAFYLLLLLSVDFVMPYVVGVCVCSISCLSVWLMWKSLSQHVSELIYLCRLMSVS